MQKVAHFERVLDRILPTEPAHEEDAMRLGTSIFGSANLRLKRRTRILAVLPVGLLMILAVAVPRASAQTCTLSQGYWKNHTSDWSLTSLTLGTKTYTAKQAENFLKAPVRGDASLILAKQLIGALLNNAAGASEPSNVSAAIAAANTDLGAGPIPEGISPSTPLGTDMVEQALVLENYNTGLLSGSCSSTPPPPPPPPPPGSCTATSSLSVMVQSSNVTGYIPKGNWDSGATGVSVVNIEGTSVTPTLISTPGAVNSCASDPKTGQTICTGNDTNVYVLTGTTLSDTLTSGASGYICFSGGCATNTGVAMDAVHGKALIGESVSGAPGFQYLDLGTLTFETPFASPAGDISEDPLIDPSRSTAGSDATTGNAAGALLLSPSERSNYEIADMTTSSSPAFYEHLLTSTTGIPDSAGEDCQTGIALAPEEDSAPSVVYIGDLTQATFTSGTPGSWTVPAGAEQQQSLSDSYLSAGASGIAVAQGTHKGVVAGEFGGTNVTAIALPTTSGSGTPAITDWVSCNISSTFSEGYDPHTVTAYQSPATGDAVALVANGTASSLAVIDLTRMLDPALVPRDSGGHVCSSGTLPASVVSFVTVP